MGKAYDEAKAATIKSLPAYIEYKVKTVANEKGIREKGMRLIRHEVDQAVMAAAKNALTHDRTMIGRIIAEDPGFLHMSLEGIRYSTIWDELVDGIARQITKDIEPKVRKAHELQYKDLGIEGFINECNLAVASAREIGLPTDEFERAVSELAEDPCHDTILRFGSTVDRVITGLDDCRRREESRRLLESSYFVLENSRTDRFTSREAPSPSRGR